MWMRSLRKRFVTFWCSMTAHFSWLIHAVQRLRNSVDLEHGHVTRNLTVNFLFPWSWRSIKCTNLRKILRLLYSSATTVKKIECFHFWPTDSQTRERGWFSRSMQRQRNLNFMVGPNVHTYPETLFTENGAFRKRSSNRRNRKHRLCVLVWTENIWSTELFDNNDVTIITWLTRAFQPAVINFLRHRVDGKHLIPFQSETPLSKFSDAEWTENIWRHFRVKTPSSEFCGVAWTGP